MKKWVDKIGLVGYSQCNKHSVLSRYISLPVSLPVSDNAVVHIKSKQPSPLNILRALAVTSYIFIHLPPIGYLLIASSVKVHLHHYLGTVAYVYVTTSDHTWQHQEPRTIYAKFRHPPRVHPKTAVQTFTEFYYSQVAPCHMKVHHNHIYPLLNTTASSLSK